MTRSQAKRLTQEGFTFMELMIAVAIIGIIVAVAVPNFLGYLKSAKINAAKAEIRSLEQSITQFNLDTGRFPANLRDLVKRPTDEAVSGRWNGPYLKKKEVPRDPWGNRYVYKLTPGQENAYELYSYGPSGRGAQKAEWISVHKI